MDRRKFVSGLLIGLIIFLIASILSYFFNFHFKLFLSLFLIDFAFLFFFKFLKIIKKPSEESFSKRLVKFLIVYGIPLLILGYVLYMNFLPFGFEKTYVLNVGTIGDTTTSNEIYLEKTNDLSEIKQDENGTNYRELNGTTSIIFKPKAILKNPSIKVSIEGERVSVISPELDFNPDDYKWDLDIDFSKGIPNFLEGNAEYNSEKKEVYFDGQSVLTYQNTKDQFETGPFMIYAEWMPEKQEDGQQIIGHYNWELWQDKDKVRFFVGRMYDKGPSYSINYPTKEDFFNNKHTAIAIYNPIQKENKKGYIQLYVDGNFAGKIFFENETIWKDYGNKDLSLGKSNHGSTIYLQGTIYNTKFSYKNLNVKESNKIDIILNKMLGNSIKIPVFGQGKIKRIELKVQRN